MSIREFTDPHGVHWRVWATTPTRGNVRPQFAAGWLTFECPAERRRLAPIPELWTEAADGELCELLERAVIIMRTDAAVLEPVERQTPSEPNALERTVTRVRAVIHEVEKTLRRATG